MKRFNTDETKVMKAKDALDLLTNHFPGKATERERGIAIASYLAHSIRKHLVERTTRGKRFLYLAIVGVGSCEVEGKELTKLLTQALPYLTGLYREDIKTIIKESA